MAYQFSDRTTVFEQVRKLLQDEKIVSWGNVVAMVAADTKEHAHAAAKKVKVEIEQLPEYMNYLDAVMPDAMRIHPSMDNIYSLQPLRKGDADSVPEMIDNAAFAVDGSFYSTKEPHMSIEGDTVQAYYDEDGLLTVHCKAMTVYFDRDDKLTKILRFMFFPYYVPNALGLARVAITNHAFGTAYRGYGAPQAYTCSEALIDMMAEKIGMDPFEFRYKNIARKGQTNLNQREFL